MIKRFLSSALFVALLCGSASADFVYTTTDGKLGHISVESATSADLTTTGFSTGLTDSPLVAAWNKGTEMVAVLQTGENQNSAIIYSGKKWSEPKSKTLTGVSGASGVAVSNNGRSLFVSSFWNGRIAEFSLDSDFAFTGLSYDCVPPTSYKRAWGEGVFVRGNVVHGLFALTSGDVATPADSRLNWLIRLDGLLGKGSKYSTPLVEGTWAVEAAPTSNGHIGFACVGGTTSGDLRIWNGSKLVSVASGDIYGEIWAVCGDSDSGFYFIGQTQASGDVANHLYHWGPQSGSANGNVELLDAIGAGTTCALAWDDTYKVLAAMTKEQITIIDKEGNSLKTLTSGVLGGIPASLAYLPRSSNKTDDKRDSSGCNAWGTLSVLIPVAAGFWARGLLRSRFRRKHERGA